MNLLKNIFVVFFAFVAVLLVVNWFFTGTIIPVAEFQSLWFYSGIIMVLFSILFIEPYYTSPKNVITNTIPLLLVLLSVEQEFTVQGVWVISLTLLALLLILSVLVVGLQDKRKSPSYPLNKKIEFVRKWLGVFGKGKVIYSGAFILFLSTNTEQTIGVQQIVILITWAVILLIDPRDLHNTFSLVRKDLNKNAIGQVFGIQSPNTFLVEVFDDKRVEKFSIVKFLLKNQDGTIIGLIIDIYMLNRKVWALVLELKRNQKDNSMQEHVVYKTTDDDETKRKIDSFVGIVGKDSRVEKIIFEYLKKENNIQEGDLLELEVENNTIFYQVVEGTTDIENLESRDEARLIKGEAIQLGILDNENLSFQKFGWVPNINTPIFMTDTNIDIPQPTYPEYKLGKIPNTNIPVVINLEDAVSHHMALLGVTGSGKSFLAREIIKQMLQKDYKIICIDFNKEFTTTLNPAPENIISSDNSPAIFANIDWIGNELEKFGNQQEKDNIKDKKNEITEKFQKDIRTFVDEKNKNIAVFELPDVANNRGILEYTKSFFAELFQIAKECSNRKIVLVLEEAHTIIPEWNFVGSNDKASQGLVNSIGQIALQGRKYGVGFLVIAQRTANVSKTVLTQCNTVVCFQSFDETSSNFLSNYVGKDLARKLPNLKQYHAIVAGKALKSNMPIIVNLERNGEN